MKNYKILIVETLEKKIDVKANDLEEAKRIVKKMWNEEKIILYPDDFTKVSFEAIGF